MRTYEPLVGTTIDTACIELVRQAKAFNESCKMSFNGVIVVAGPQSSAAKLADKWHQTIEEQAKRWRESAEYQRQVREQAIRDNEQRQLFAEWISAAPPMKFSNEELWNEIRAVNANDPYSARTVDYAEQWARLMQAKIDEGATVESCADECGTVADYDGITGYMYGSALSILIRTWVHGEELRSWHERGRK